LAGLALFGSRSHSRVSENAAELRIRALMAAHFEFVWRSLRRLGLSAAAADAGTQDVFVIASRKLSAIATPSEKRFLFATALRVASRRRALARRRADPEAEPSSVLDGSEPSRERLAELAHARRHLNEILAAMKVEQRAVFVLYELEEMTVPDIAALLDLPIGTVSSRLRVAREEFDLSLRRLRAREQIAGVKA
jgi:RNA polymerase sigma-70 factor (ECF subfamily)